MKIDQIPDIYIEQYLLGELPENLRKEMDNLMLNNPDLNNRIEKIKKSNEDILSVHTAESMLPRILEKLNSRKTGLSAGEFTPKTGRKTSSGIIDNFTGSFKNIIEGIRSVSSRRYTLSIASAAVMILVIVFMIPGIRSTDNTGTTYDETVRIKGLDSKLLLFRMKGRDIEELKNSDAARKGDIIQVGYIATGNYRHGIILSIDGRGTVTLHLPDSSTPGQELIMNKKVILNKSYELDDSPSFERFIMILSPEPINTSEIIEKAKILAAGKEEALNGLIGTEKESIELSITLKKTE